MNPPRDFQSLRETSARLGADPLLVQGAGGNTSIKQGGVMWIKASGAWLADALTQDMFVAADWPGLRAAVERGDPEADQPAAFALTAGALRPSIETCLHALFDQPIVLHVHCVATIALAVRRDARALLADYGWAYVDYAKPGAELAQKVLKAMQPQTQVVILGNHGLLVAGDDPAEAEARLRAVSAALAVDPAPSLAPDFADLTRRAGGGYLPAPAGHPLHDVALRPTALAAATRGSLYPDHVVFCGPGAMALAPADDPAAWVARLAARGLKPPPFLLAPGAGAWLAEAAGAGPLAMARCLGDVLARVPEGADLNYLTDDETAALLDWDAEKYRQALHA